MYKVKLQQFEGPMDLLVYLIEHARMSIYDIKVSEITAQYLDYIAEMKKQDLEVAQEFMVLAAELIELKSRMLLPGSEPEEDDSAEDPRNELVARILEYKQYKEMAEFLGDQQELTWHVRTKPKEDLEQYTGEADELLKGDINKFAEAFRSFLLKKQRVEEIRRTYERVERQRMSVETRISQIFSMFKNRKKKSLKFSEMIEEDSSRFNKVVTFMGLLEMLKDKSVEAEQEKRFGDITVKLKEEEDDKQQY